ncbi:ArsR family transcriptional regulator, partial [Pseudomonas aeruginosa]
GDGGYPSVQRGLVSGSRELEIDPLKKEIVWHYTAEDSQQPGWAFYSAYISSARRLPNGNSLIDEGENRRFIQVTPGGVIV